MDQRLNALIAKHCDWLSASVVTVGGYLKEVGRGECTLSFVIMDIRSLVHQIIGSSGSMGFMGVSQNALKLEHYLQGLECTDTIGDGAYKEVLELFRSVKIAADQATPETSSLYNLSISELVGQA